MEVTTLDTNTLAGVLSNTEPTSPFYKVGYDTLRALADLLRLFTTAITTTVAPVPAATAHTLLVAPSPRVISSPALLLSSRPMHFL